MYRVGVVCEGPSDQVIIEAVLDSCMDDYILKNDTFASDRPISCGSLKFFNL